MMTIAKPINGKYKGDMCAKERVPLFNIEIFNHFLGTLCDQKKTSKCSFSLDLMFVNIIYLHQVNK
jgi:hypothetical protein